MWSIVAYGGLAALALVVEALYVFVRQPPWYHHAITVFFLLLFGSQAYTAWQRMRVWRQQLAYFDQVFHADNRHLHILPLLAGVSLIILLSLAGDTLAMTCTTHTYYVDGRYVMCQTCCTNGMCNTMCF